MRFGTIHPNVNGTVVSKPRKTNAEQRPREFLKPEEVESLIKAAKSSRCGDRDSLMIAMAYNHALRATELVSLEWDQIDLENGQIRVTRVKNSEEGMHFLAAKEISALKALRKLSTGRFVFLSEGRINPISIRGFHKLVVLAGERAGFDFPIHPHMLRHAKGYQLANRNTDLRLIQTYLGHKAIQHTVRYTKLNPNMVKGLEK